MFQMRRMRKVSGEKSLFLTLRAIRPMLCGFVVVVMLGLVATTSMAEKYKFPLDATLAGMKWDDIHIDVDTDWWWDADFEIPPQPVVTGANGAVIPGTTGATDPIRGDDHVNITGINPSQNPSGLVYVTATLDGSIDSFNYWFTFGGLKVGQSFYQKIGENHNNPLPVQATNAKVDYGGGPEDRLVCLYGAYTEDADILSIEMLSSDTYYDTVLDAFAAEGSMAVIPIIPTIPGVPEPLVDENTVPPLIYSEPMANDYYYFRTSLDNGMVYNTMTTVPEPSTILLLLCGGVSLMGFRFRKR